MRQGVRLLAAPYREVAVADGGSDARLRIVAHGPLERALVRRGVGDWIFIDDAAIAHAGVDAELGFGGQLQLDRAVANPQIIFALSQRGIVDDPQSRRNG